MTRCNKCGGPMVPDITAIVPALGCVDCGRLMPVTKARAVRADRPQVNRMLRAARRSKIGKEAA